MKSETRVWLVAGRNFGVGIALCMGACLFSPGAALAKKAVPSATPATAQTLSHEQILRLVEKARVSNQAHDADQVGWAYYNHQDYANARAWFEHALKVNPNDRDGSYGLALSRLGAGYLGEAEAIALAHDTDDPRMQTLLGEIYAHAGYYSHQSHDYVLSVEQYKRAQKYRPLTDAELRVKADDYLKLNRPDDAARIFKKINRTDHDAPSAEGLQAARAEKKVYQKTDRLPAGDWKTFKAKFVSREGRVIDSGNKNVSHSEGQGYGMLLAVAYGDRPTFDRIWKWTQAHLQVRGDHLFSWRWNPTPAPGEKTVNDPNNASDGGLLIAWALFRAYRAWGDPAYQQASRAIVEELKRKCIVQTRFGPSLLPAEVGFVRGPEVVLNPSYFVFQAYRELGEANSSNNWMHLEASGVSIISQGRAGKWHLSPDWVEVSPQSVSLPSDFPADFGYNAVRVPLYIAWRDPQSPLLQPFYNFWHSFPAGGRVPAGVNLVTNQAFKDPALPGMLAVSRWVTACVEKKPIHVDNIPALSRSEDYYSACLKLLTKVAIQETNARSAMN